MTEKDTQYIRQRIDELFEGLSETRTLVASIDGKLEGLVEGLGRVRHAQNDHESRLRTIELRCAKRQSIFQVLSAAIGAAASAAVYFLFGWLRK